MLKILYIILGTISLILGILGIFLPLLPTTPFLLLSSYLYFNSSTRCYNFLINQKYLGPYIQNFTKYKIIPLRSKIFILTLMWSSMIYCSIFLIPNAIFKILLMVVAVGVTLHILSFKSK